MDGISRAEYDNPVFVIDEADKTTTSTHGNPQDALLEVIDPEQNDAFKDHYVDVKYDLSDVLFILTANELSQISPPLIDRCEVIYLHSYTHQEKMAIAKEFLLPRQIHNSGINEEDIEFADGWIDYIIQAYTGEPGVRNLERRIGNICEAIATMKVKDKAGFTKVVISKDFIHDELGPPQYTLTTPIWEVLEEIPGTTNYMAWTGAGGKVGQLQVDESDNKDAKADIITGNLKDIMKESVAVSKHAALRVFKELVKAGGNIPPQATHKADTNPILHVHFCEGAIPKDGPSAGVPISMAIVSKMLNRSLRKDVAATGEVALDGTITKIAGVREKVTAAISSNITSVYLPKDNQADFEELPEELRDKVNVHYVSNINELFPDVLVSPDGAKVKTYQHHRKDKLRRHIGSNDVPYEILELQMY
jgi:ATP-dependent Lon protease